MLHHIRIHKIKGVLFKLSFEKSYREVLLGIGFDNKFVHWIWDIFNGSRACINLNGDLGDI